MDKSWFSEGEIIKSYSIINHEKMAKKRKELLKNIISKEQKTWILARYRAAVVDKSLR